MRKTLLAIVVIAIALSGQPQAQAVAHYGDGIAWNMPDTALVFPEMINRFNICYDATNCSDVPLTSKFTDTPTAPAGTSSYLTMIPNSLATGNHTVTVKACNAASCGDPTAPLAFVLQLGKPTVIPSLLRLKTN